MTVQSATSTVNPPDPERPDSGRSPAEPDRGESLSGSALAYAATQHWHVFPVAPRSKVPHAGSRGLLDATTDPDQIRRWWSAEPESNVGVVMSPSGLLGFDVDLYDGRADDKKLEKLQETLGELPDTVVQKSGSGDGYHFLFKHPGGPIRGDIGGVVLRARAYLVVAPSIHPSGGSYSWVEGKGPGDVDVAELPHLWIDALRPTSTVGVVGMPSVESEPAWLQAISQEERLAAMRASLAAETGEVKGVSPAGTTFNVARSAARGFAVRDSQAVLDAMTEIYDAKCVPPWEHRMGRHVWNAYERAHSPEWGERLMPESVALEELGIPADVAPITAIELITALARTSRRLQQSSTPAKKRDGRALARVLEGKSLSGKPLSTALHALVRWSPSRTPSLLIAECLARSVLALDGDAIVGLVEDARAKVQSEEERERAMCRAIAESAERMLP